MSLERLAFPYFGIYGASKWALEVYSESLRYGLAPFGVDVAIVDLDTFKIQLIPSLDVVSRLPTIHNTGYFIVLDAKILFVSK